MKNITDFNQFKNNKLNEEATADPRAGSYGGGGDTYFANVKGNFAGSDQTLVGSAVIKLFRFVKRKGMQVLLYTWFKPNLYREYMSGLLRYIIRSNMNLPKAKTLYDAEFIMDEQKQKLEQSEKLKIKFVRVTGGTEETSEKDYNAFKVGSEVKNEQDQPVKSGYYKLAEFGRIIFVKDGKLQILDASIEEEGIEPAEDESKEVKEVEIDKDITEFINKIKAEYAKGNVKPEITTQSIKETDELISFFTESISEMKDLLKDNTKEGDEIIRIKQDLVVYEADMKALTELKAEISKKTNPVKTETTSKPEAKPEAKPVEIKKESMVNEEVDVAGVGGEVKNVARTAGQIKVGDQKVTKNKRIGDELNQLSQVDIDLNDPEFVKQFDDKAVKEACTNVVLEGKAEICKLQLGAERLYMHTDDKGGLVPDAKLQNNWLKMIQSIKNQFSRFMLVDVVDPIVLRNKLNSDEISKYQSDNNSAVKKPVKELSDALKASNNPKLNEALIFDKKFEGQRDGDFGMTTINDMRVVYCLNHINLGSSKTSCYTYKVVGYVQSGMTDDTTSPDFKSYVIKEVNRFPKYFRPIGTGKIIVDSTPYEHFATFIVGNKGHLSVGANQNWVNIIFAFSKTKNLKELNDTTIKDCVFFCKSKEGKTDIRLSSTVTENTEEARKSALIPIFVSNPWIIKSDKKSIFNVSDDDSKVNLQQLGTNYNNLIQIRK